MRFLYRFFNHDKQTSQKLFEMEKKISDLEKELKRNINELLIKTETKEIEKEKETIPTINIEHLQVDKIIIEKLDYANNFGQLGIKELSGKLNIGTSYEGDLSKLVQEKVTEKLGPQAKVNVRAKKPVKE
ncbi:hypothetical protein [Neobacillus sp. PS3-40]|uniref:hypothetical protein n=1 Tax=Neobacillus sp. PS3-40 TaxID=3070679 RepID=UPI0027E07D71|nr:hypothetical protein [Neobacillus sp. PS3-40]WML44985.1 hypothetical protein RCG20_03515 [Neobacillus sp. PS3-40]